MAAIPFPLSSAPGAYPQETGGRLINAHVEPLGEGGRAKVRWIRPPGLKALSAANGAYTGFRGGIAAGGGLIVIFGNRAQFLSLSGSTFTMTDLGVLSGTEPVTCAKNNKAPTPDIVTVTGSGAFNLFTASAPTAFADTDIGIPNSVSFGGGYFIFTYGDGAIRTSGLNDVTIDPLAVAKAEQRSDGLLAGRVFASQFYAFGQSSIEAYRFAGTTPFPLAYVTMIPRGLIGPYAVAGNEEGWSNELIWVGDDGVVYQLQGYGATPISTPSVHRDIARTADKTKLHASVYMAQGHAYWQIKTPEWCWVYDLSTGHWHERQSYLRPTCRAQGGVNAFGRWICGDDATGDVWELAAGHPKEGGDHLIFHVESAPVHGFPARIAIPRMDFMFTSGTGALNGATQNEENPHIEISWSDDGGMSWGAPLLRPLGRYAKDAAVTVLRTGLTTRMGRQVRLRGPDPVYYGLMGGTMAANARRE